MLGFVEEALGNMLELAAVVVEVREIRIGFRVENEEIAILVLAFDACAWSLIEAIGNGEIALAAVEVHVESDVGKGGARVPGVPLSVMNQAEVVSGMADPAGASVSQLSGATLAMRSPSISRMPNAR